MQTLTLPLDPALWKVSEVACVYVLKEGHRLTRWKRRELGSGGGCSMAMGGGG